MSTIELELMGGFDMSKRINKVNGRKRLIKNLRKTLDDDKASVKRIRQLTAEIMIASEELGTNPETLLFEINIVKVMAEEALMLKFKEELILNVHGLPSKKELRMRGKNIRRLREVILGESEFLAYAFMENQKSQGNTQPRNSGEKVGSKGNEGTTVHKCTSTNLRPFYIN
jgi:hypothetical protein